MAITGGDRHVWRALRTRELIPDRPAVLEIGRANWYGDVSQAALLADREEFSEGRDERPTALGPWQAADWYYDFMLRMPRRTAIDLDQEAEAQRLNLNEPLPRDMRDAFNVVINTGTNEHVFDQRQVWESIHQACKVGGLMVHAVPLWGWLDHGFFNVQPTLVADLAAENGYEILEWIIHEIDTGWMARIETPGDVQQHQHRSRDHSAMMHFALRKTLAAAFRVPMQGVYSSRASAAMVQTWQRQRGVAQAMDGDSDQALYLALPCRPDPVNDDKIKIVKPTGRGVFKIGRSRIASLLCLAFNKLWCYALNLRPECNNFGMCHDDVFPTPLWADVLIDERDRIGAAVCSAVVPIKDDRGLTTTAIRNAETGDTRRLTMAEIFELPETFDLHDVKRLGIGSGGPPEADLLAVNTGLWVCRLTDAWVDHFPGFSMTDGIKRRPDGRLAAGCISEDWQFSEWLHSRGQKVVATRKVALAHRDLAGKDYRNDHVWGEWATDRGDT